MNIYGLIIGIGLVILLSSFEKKNNRSTIIPTNHLNLFLTFLLLSAIIGARAYHVFDYWSYYSQNYWEILNLRGGGLGIFGAITGGALFILSYSLFRHIDPLDITDLLAPTLPLTQSIARWGNYINREVYSPNGQPLWLYESIFCFIMYLYISRYPKDPTSKYLIGYGLLRLVLDNFRNDTWTINGLKISQLLSIIFIILGLLLILWRKRKTPLAPSSGYSA